MYKLKIINDAGKPYTALEKYGPYVKMLSKASEFMDEARLKWVHDGPGKWYATTPLHILTIEKIDVCGD